MPANWWLLCVLFVAIVCTPLTARSTSKPRRNHLKHHNPRVPDFDPTHIVERNRTKNIQRLSAVHWGLPKVEREGYWKPSSRSLNVLLRAPMPRHNFHEQNVNNTGFNQGTCKDPVYKDPEKERNGCRPRDVVVHLVHVDNLILQPSAVVVKRCDGMCNVHSKCVPTRTINRTFHIRQIQYNQADCGSVEVEEHIACKCSCPERSSQCTPDQIYDQEQCKCKCPKEVNRKCKSAKMEFKYAKCKCECKDFKRCSTGTKFDEKKCRCIKL